MIENSLSKKIIILTSLSIILVLVVVIFIFFDIKNRNNNIVKLENDLSNQDKKNQYLVSANNIIKNSNIYIDEINNSILTSEDDILIIEKIEDIAKKNGLEISIDSILVEDVASISPNGLTTLKIKAKTVGSWSGTYSFINEIESMEEKVRIDKLFLDTEKIEVVKSNSNQKWQSILEIRFLKLKNK